MPSDIMSTSRAFTVLYNSVGGDDRIIPGESIQLEAIVGETLTLRPDLPLGTFAGSVLSAPPGSSAAWTGASFTADVHGRYRLRVTNGTALPIEFEIVAFRPEALSWPAVAGTPAEPRPMRSRRLVLRNIASGRYSDFGRRPSDAEFAATTAAYPVPIGLDLSRAGNPS